MRCRCWECVRGGMFADVAPRLARAHADEIAARRARREKLRRDRNDLMRAERLLAHRELQFVRARGRRYTAERARKLAEARLLVERLRARVEAA